MVVSRVMLFWLISVFLVICCLLVWLLIGVVILV